MVYDRPVYVCWAQNLCWDIYPSTMTLEMRSEAIITLNLDEL